MPDRVRLLGLFDRQSRELRRRGRAEGQPARRVEQARIVLWLPTPVGVGIAERVGCSEPTVVGWRSRFAGHGLVGLDDAPRSGKPPRVPEVSQLGLPSCLWWR